MNLNVYLFLMLFYFFLFTDGLKDFDNCKLTAQGSDYFEELSMSGTGSICLHWDTHGQNYSDHSFPDGSRKAARNYCRNPSNDPLGPWCYTLSSNAINKEYCDIKLCKYTDCKVSGIGQEYHGKQRKTVTFEQCVPWSNPEHIKYFAHLEGTINCANPTGNSSGPWCMIKGEFGEISQICDIPICDFPDYGKILVNSEYSIFNEINQNKSIIEFKTKLWNPAIYDRTGQKIFFSSLPIFDGALGFVLELITLNNGGGIKLSRWPLPKLPVEYEDFFTWKPKLNYKNNLIASSGVSWTNLWVTIDKSNIKVGQIGKEDIPLASLEIKKEILEFYSLSGAKSMWIFPKQECEMIQTHDLKFSQLYQLKRTDSGHELIFSVRAFHSVFINFYYGIEPKNPIVQMTLQHEKKNSIQIFTNDYGKILDENYDIIFTDPWQWLHFTISIFDDIIQIMWQKNPSVTVKLLNGKHSVIKGLKWFSIGSRETLTQWSIHCFAPRNDSSVEAIPPECVHNKEGFSYTGHQRAAESGRPCLPWSHKYINKKYQDAKLFPDNSLLDASNYCRNPDKYFDGPWCFTSIPYGYPRERCHIRPCRFENCRMAGTGNDYMGFQNKTISGRICQSWNENYPHIIPKSVLNVTRFPERDLDKAKNYCRNPTRSITGSWCYTIDPLLPRDVCDIENCDTEDECTIITVKNPPTSNIYILPKWKIEGLKFWLKEWDPEKPDGIQFTIRPLTGSNHYLLLIGSKHNEAIELYYVNNERKNLLKEKSMPHIIPVGQWAGFWLRINTGNIEFGFEHDKDPIFRWKDRSRNPPITPMLLGFGSIYNNLIGIHFSCDECLTQHFDGKDLYPVPELQENIYPINLWRPNSDKNNFELYARGKGYLLIQLFQFPGDKDFAQIMLGEYFMFRTTQVEHLLISELLNDTVITNEWRKFNIRYNETDMFISYDKTSWHYKYKDDEHAKNIFHYFLIQTKGSIDWSVNCPPIDVSGTPRDGGWSQWSEWQCSVSCGGGKGIRKRICNNPEPNIFGKYCHGSDTMVGKCNQFSCSKAPKEILLASRKYINSAKHEYMLNPGENWHYKVCNPPVLKKIKSDLRVNYKLAWSKDGTYFKNNVKVTSLFLNYIKEKDSGIYTLELILDDNTSITLCVATLAVNTNIYPRINKNIKLASNSLVLSNIYPDLKLKWVFNNITWINYGVVPLIEVKNLEIKNIKIKHNGQWTCVVTQPQLEFSWVTAWYNIEVQPSNALLSFLLEDPIASKIFYPIKSVLSEALVIPTFIIFTFLSIVFIFFIVRKYIRSRRLKLINNN